MRILHTADWHLGKTLLGYSRHEEQVIVLDEICTIAEKEEVDLVLIAGDVYDTFNPPIESQSLLYTTLKRLSADGNRPVVVIAGNHDSPDRLNSPNPLALELGILFIGYPLTILNTYHSNPNFKIIHTDKGYIEIKLNKYKYTLRLLVTPYANDQRLRYYIENENHTEKYRAYLANHWNGLMQQYYDSNSIHILVAHLFICKSPNDIITEDIDAEKPVLGVGGAEAVFISDLPENLSYVALGHLHSYMNLGDKYPVVYSSSILQYSFKEINQQKGVVIIDAIPQRKLSYQFKELNGGYKLYKVKAKSHTEAIELLMNFADAIIELTIEAPNPISQLEREEIRKSIPQNVIILEPILWQNTAMVTETEASFEYTNDMDITELFKAYYKSEYSADADDLLIQTFNEIVATEIER
jgi:exonuclease SbcD